MRDDAADLKARLASQALSVCKYLLPNGRQAGHEYCVGSIYGEAGNSLKVHLDGERAGLWGEFNGGTKKGDLIDLWREVRGLDVAGAFEEVRDFLGVDTSIPFKKLAKKPERKTYTLPGRLNNLDPNGPGRAYLNERGISNATLKRCKVKFDRRSIYFPAFEPGEAEPTLIKYRDVEDKHRTGPTGSGQKPILIGWQAVNPNARELWIVEGEIDMLSGYELGLDAVLSVPFGGGGGKKQQWIESDFPRLAIYDRIYVATDMDGPGDEAAVEIISRLGEDRCIRVELPAKDMNECLQAGLGDPNDWKLVVVKPEELRKPTEYADTVMDMLYGTPKGITLPWRKSHNEVRCREAELIVVNGFNGHGKSQLLGHVLIDAMSKGEQVCIFSGELIEARLLSRMVKQVRGDPNKLLGREEAELALEWLDESLFIFALTGTAKLERLLEVFEFAYRQHGVKVFAIDSFMMLGFGADDFNAQKAAMNRLVDFKNKFGVTIFLVVHPRKAFDETKVPGKQDVKGDSSITDLADTVFAVWRDFGKEWAIAELKPDEWKTDKHETLAAKPDCVLAVQKQRNGDWDGEYGLFYNRWSFQYMEDRSQQPMEYLAGSTMS